MTLTAAQTYLRRRDKALRVWRSQEHPAMVSLDRKTFVGRIGAVLPDGLEYRPDAGYRRENGLTHVAYVPLELFDVRRLDEQLKAADTWRHGEPAWMRVEAAESRAKAARAAARKDDIRYRATELWDRYAWMTKSRVNVPTAIG